jgi:hypothetical protein
MAATTTGKYVGKQPAITLAIATFSALIRRCLTGSTPMTSSLRKPAAAKKFATAD